MFEELPPPYKPFVSSTGIPSICSGLASAEISALPKINTPPHNPWSDEDRPDPKPEVPFVLLSADEVNTIGLAAFPLAIILPPLAIIKADASAPVPGAPLITVPASIVKVTPSTTITLPFKV